MNSRLTSQSMITLRSRNLQSRTLYPFSNRSIIIHLSQLTRPALTLTIILKVTKHFFSKYHRLTSSSSWSKFHVTHINILILILWYYQIQCSLQITLNQIHHFFLLSSQQILTFLVFLLNYHPFKIIQRLKTILNFVINRTHPLNLIYFISYIFKLFLTQLHINLISQLISNDSVSLRIPFQILHHHSQMLRQFVLLNCLFLNSFSFTVIRKDSESLRKEKRPFRNLSQLSENTLNLYHYCYDS